MWRALLIDDQPPARDDLRDLLAAHADIVVVDEAGTAGRARTLLALDHYDVVFLDIDLGHGEDGFDLLAAVRPGARVVFVTAFDEHAVRAFETEALDYLLKPVEPARLAKCLRRLRGPAGGEPGQSFTTESGLIPVRIGPITRVLRRHDIRAITSCENYTEVGLVAGERFLVRRTMQQWEETLRGGQFARVHRQLIVNLAQVTRIEHVDEERIRLVLAAGEAMDVSRRYAPELKAKHAWWQAAQAAPREARPDPAGRTHSA